MTEQGGGRQIAAAVSGLLAFLGALQVLDPTTLGLPPQVPAWAGLLATALGAYAALALPAAVQTTPPAEPESDEPYP